MPSSPPTILAFDTSAAHCAAVLLRGGDIIASRHEELGRTQVQRLFPLLQELMTDAACDWSDLHALAVCTGPGNFTGTRIGVSAARGLAMSLNIPAIGVSVFDAAALAANTQKQTEIIVGMALPREQFAVQKFQTGTPPVAISEPEITTNNITSPFNVENIARFAALRFAQKKPVPRPAPLYLRPADAAPGKDKAPVILDDA